MPRTRTMHRCYFTRASGCWGTRPGCRHDAAAARVTAQPVCPSCYRYSRNFTVTCQEYHESSQKNLLYYNTCINKVSGLFTVLCTDMPQSCLALLTTSYPTGASRGVTMGA
jgi:hypothetical protein